MDASLLVLWAIRFLFLGLLYLFLARVVLVLLAPRWPAGW